MEVQQILHMNGGEGEISYSKNSLYQKGVLLKLKPVVEESITKLYCTSFPECLKVADLGCASGPNALLPLWEIIEAIDKICCRLNRKPPTFQVFLNDLPGNDFNTLFRYLPSFYQKLDKEKGSNFGPCFIAGMPGSFHGRLFPDNSIHFFHSSYSAHFLSQPPEGLTSEFGTPLNKGNIIVAKTSSSGVRRAYMDQFERDFIRFLRLRSEELVSGGYMVCTMVSRTKDMDDSSCKSHYQLMELMGITLNDMAKEGLLGESDLDCYNYPLYAASMEELRHLIDTEGSFSIVQLETFEQKWDANIEDGNKDLVFDAYDRGKHIAAYMRAALEPSLSSHFGNAIIEDLFQRFALKLVDYIEMGTGVFHNIVISIVKN